MCVCVCVCVCVYVCVCVCVCVGGGGGKRGVCCVHTTKSINVQGSGFSVVTPTCIVCVGNKKKPITICGF